MILVNWIQNKLKSKKNLNIYQKLSELETRIEVLEEENKETTNELYRLENSLDSRIDILAERCRIN